MKLHPTVAALVKAMQKAAKKTGFKVKVTSTTRSRLEQEELYANRSSNPYPVARPGRSQHEYGFAVDLVAVPYDFQNYLVNWWVSVGGYWSAGDPIHFAAFDPQTWAQILGQVEVGQSQFQPTSVAQTVTIPMGLTTGVTTSEKILVSQKQIDQAVTLAQSGQPGLAVALATDPSVGLTPSQVSQLTTAVPNLPTPTQGFVPTPQPSVPSFIDTSVTTPSRPSQSPVVGSSLAGILRTGTGTARPR